MYSYYRKMFSIEIQFSTGYDNKEMNLNSINSYKSMIVDY